MVCVENLRSIGKPWGLYHVKTQVKIKEDCSKSSPPKYDRKGTEVKFPLIVKDATGGI